MMSNIAVLKEDGLTSLCFQISTLGLKIVGRLFHSYNRPLSPQVPPPLFLLSPPEKCCDLFPEICCWNRETLNRRKGAL